MSVDDREQHDKCEPAGASRIVHRDGSHRSGGAEVLGHALHGHPARRASRSGMKPALVRENRPARLIGRATPVLYRYPAGFWPLRAQNTLNGTSVPDSLGGSGGMQPSSPSALQPPPPTRMIPVWQGRDTLAKTEVRETSPGLPFRMPLAVCPTAFGGPGPLLLNGRGK
jgi:hypothetical protein